MIEAGRGGRIINVASINALVAGRGIGRRHYEAAKAAVLQFTRTLALDWAPHEITANVICRALRNGAEPQVAGEQSGGSASLASVLFGAMSSSGLITLIPDPCDLVFTSAALHRRELRGLDPSHDQFDSRYPLQIASDLRFTYRITGGCALRL